MMPGPTEARQTLQDGVGPFVVRYAHHLAAPQFVSQTASLLGVVGYGAERPDDWPMAYPFVAAPLVPVGGDPVFEIWTTAVPTQPCRVGPVAGAFGDDVAFGAIELEEAGAGSLEEAVESAYLKIFDFLVTIGVTVPIRFWNYLDAITDDSGGLQRYMRFNIGRQRAFAARLRQPIPPSASGVGGRRGASMIYFLAARDAARPIENPRQVSAYSYPSIYGPTSPSFSRASIFTQGLTETLLVSGTASIVGHETLHEGNRLAQIEETLENLRAVINAASRTVSPTRDDQWALKAYLREANDQAAVDAAITAMFGPNCQRLYLLGDICRKELVVEIEAVGRFRGAQRNFS